MKNFLAVIGTTGVGKSKLAVDLALAFNGEIINADSMQVYKGLEIITNKMPAKERMGIPHHLMDEIDPDQDFTVQDWSKRANELISEIHSRNKLPIIVGGTHYYLQTILWESQLILEEKDGMHSSLEGYDQEILSKLKNILEISKENPSDHTESMLKLLKVIDPVMGKRWHPNDGRKLRRSLEIFYFTGKKQSDIINSQNVKPKYRSCIIWPWSEFNILEKRLNSRIEDMIQSGLLNEIKTFHSSIHSKGLDYTRGILQSIGFKEFHEYLSNQENQELLTQGIELMKLHTRQYAKRQITWINNKLIPRLKEPHSCISVNATNIQDWDNISKGCQGQISQFLKGEYVFSVSSTKKSVDTNIFTWKQFECSVCRDVTKNSPRIFNGIHEWNVHIKTRKHLRNLARNHD